MSKSLWFYDEKYYENSEDSDLAYIKDHPEILDDDIPDAIERAYDKGIIKEIEDISEDDCPHLAVKEVVVKYYLATLYQPAEAVCHYTCVYCGAALGDECGDARIVD